MIVGSIIGACQPGRAPGCQAKSVDRAFFSLSNFFFVQLVGNFSYVRIGVINFKVFDESAYMLLSSVARSIRHWAYHACAFF